jgi:hypothetical protein
MSEWLVQCVARFAVVAGVVALLGVHAPAACGVDM